MIRTSYRVAVFLSLLMSLSLHVAAQTNRSKAPEEIALGKLCAFENAPKELVLTSRFEFSRVDAFPCISKVLAALNTLQLAKDQKLQVGEQLIWNMASLLQDPGNLDPAVRNNIVPMLRRIANDEQNPMRGHAWLALTYVDATAFPPGQAALERLKKLEESLLQYSDEELEKKAETEHRTIMMPALLFENAPALFVDRFTWFIAETYNAVFDPSVTSNENPPFGYRALAFFQGVVFFPTDVAERCVAKQMKSSRLILTGTIREQPAAIPDMAFTVNEHLCAGRSGCIDIPAKKSSSLSNDSQWKGWLSENGGTQSDSWVMIDALQTLRFPGHVLFSGGVRSYARGGFRNASLTESSEDQASIVNFSIAGTSTIPTCPSPGNCTPVYQGFFNLANDDSSGRVFATIEQAGQTRGLNRGQAFFLDVSKDSATVKVSVTRNFQHVGACCEAGPLSQAISLHLWDPAAPMSGIVEAALKAQGNSNIPTNYATNISLLLGSGSRFQSNGASASYFPFGELLSDLRSINPSEFSKRYIGIYLRLTIAKFLLAQSDFALTGLERQSIQRAQSYLSARAKLLYLDTVKYEIKDKTALVQSMDPTFLDKAIAALLKGEKIESKPNPQLIEQIRELERLNAFTESSSLRKNLEAYDRAIAVDNALEAVVDLMEFRRVYLQTLGKLKTDLNDLAVERTQLEMQ